jgi:hypothetical protein
MDSQLNGLLGGGGALGGGTWWEEVMSLEAWP